MKIDIKKYAVEDLDDVYEKMEKFTKNPKKELPVTENKKKLKKNKRNVLLR